MVLLVKHFFYQGRGRVIKGERREGPSQGTCMTDPQTWTTGWGLTVGTAGRGEQRGKIGTNIIE